MASERKPAPVTRRNFLGHALLASASSALIQASGFLGAKGWLNDARAAAADATFDTFNGLLAFVVPGSDSYSSAQGVSTPELGGVSVGAANVLIATMDESTPFVPSFSAQVAAILNGLALAVNPLRQRAVCSAVCQFVVCHEGWRLRDHGWDHGSPATGRNTH
jgi:hypothetical protein